MGNKYTITIEEVEGGLAINCVGTGSPDSIAVASGLALMRLAEDIIPKAVKAAAQASNCQCEKCQAARATLTPTSNTRH